MKNWLKHPISVQICGTLVLATYACVGAIIFHHLESGAQTRHSRIQYHAVELTEPTSKCLQKSLQNVTSSNRPDENNLKQLVHCMQYQMEEETMADWSFASSLLFTFTVITTIGYGHVYPITYAGKTFFIFYALIGIPVTLVFLANVGRFMIEGGNWINRKFRRYILQKKDEDEQEISTGGLFIVGFVLYTMMGAAALPFYEKLNFFDSIYFIFVTLTTIGLGDMYPKSSTAMICVSLAYISIGLALTSVAIGVLSEYMRKMHHFGRKLANLAKAEIWIGDKKATVGSLVGTFCDTHGIARPTQSELESLVEKAAAEIKRRKVETEPKPPDVKVKEPDIRRGTKSNIFDVDKSLVAEEPKEFGEIGYKHDPKLRYEHFQEEWAKYKIPGEESTKSQLKKLSERLTELDPQAQKMSEKESSKEKLTEPSTSDQAEASKDTRRSSSSCESCKQVEK